MNCPENAGCHFCGATDARKRHRIRKLWIVECLGCGVLYTHPRVTCNYDDRGVPIEQQRAEYERDYWPHRQETALRYWDTLEAYRQTGRLLDVGCGFGFFLNEAQQRRWTAVGVEIAGEQAEWGRQRFGLEIVPNLDDERLGAGQFDVITMWDVIEHVADSESLLRRCRELLQPGGLLLVRTPNAEGLALRAHWWSWPLLELYWQLAYPANPWEHVYHFTPAFLQRLLQNNGFAVRRFDLDEPWGSRPLGGRNWAVAVARRAVARLAWKMKLPYEVTAIAEPCPTGVAAEERRP
jgi:SAM-dependent methyltransferase